MHYIHDFQYRAWLNLDEGFKVEGEKRYRMQYNLDIVRLRTFANAFVHQLSEGIKQRVAIARALALNPKILLKHELFIPLDVQTRVRLYNQLLRMHQETNKTVCLLPIILMKY